MNIYKLSIESLGYDTYDAAIVVAEDASDAMTIHPSGNDDDWIREKQYDWYTWVSYDDLEKITVTLIGKADESQERGVVLSSFNAG